MRMKRPVAILLAIAIVLGIPIAVAEITGLIASEDTTYIVGVLVGVAFGAFAVDIYRALLGKQDAVL